MFKFNPSKYVKSNVTLDDVNQIKKAFDAIDLDHSNSISPLEIRAFFQRIQLVDSKESIYDMLKEMDEDYSGGVEFDEFIVFLTAIFDEKEKRAEIRKLLQKGVELTNKKNLETVKKSDRSPKRSENQPEKAKDEEKTKEGGFSREKQKKEVLRSKPKTSNKGKETSQANEFDPEPYISVTTSKETVTDLKKAFDILDEDGSGFVSPAEIQKYFEKMGLNTKSRLIYQILNGMDKDNSGSIDFDEFIRFITEKISDKTPNLRDEIEQIFAFFDSNGNGKVSWAELKVVSKFLGEEMSDEELKEMFVKADLDDDGFVSVDDFYNIWTGKEYY